MKGEEKKIVEEESQRILNELSSKYDDKIIKSIGLKIYLKFYKDKKNNQDKINE